MISQVHIKNFKSIVDLTIDLGRVNLFIGENGSGKSNILEAVAFASSGTRVDMLNSDLFAKGVRVSKPELYSSAFKEESADIEFNFVIDGHSVLCQYNFDNHWYDLFPARFSQRYRIFLSEFGKYINADSPDFNLSNIIIKPETPQTIRTNISEEAELLENYNKYRLNSYLTNYMIYSPENSSLRKFEEEGQVKPVGVKGEGLFSLLKSMAEDSGTFEKIKDQLEAIDWFEDFAIPSNLLSNEYKIIIRDRYIGDIEYFDQRSANEGFLFLLFYIVLFSSKKTPQFFAIDNIEASFNPKLCSKLINILVELSRKNNKQVLMTTHNPATLDGLDLNDPEQRLFVVRRNIDGHTIVTRISEKPKLTMPMKLSEMWTKGLLGGLPDNF